MNDLLKMSLFSGIAPDEIDGLLEHLHAKRVEYKTNALIVQKGSQVTEFGLVLTGQARSIIWDESGRIVTLTMLGAGSVMGVMVAASSKRKSPVTVQALDDVTALMIPFDQIFSTHSNTQHSHQQFLRNYLSEVAEKGLVLHERIDCLLRPTVRGKIIAYLERIAVEQNCRTVLLPFNRNAMAEYLNIERSALSRELSKMKDDGLIEYHKNQFDLLSPLFSERHYS